MIMSFATVGQTTFVPCALERTTSIFDAAAQAVARSEIACAMLP
jgi:hypothetical protein